MTQEEIQRKRYLDLELRPEERYIDAYSGKKFREGNMRLCMNPEVRKRCAFFRANGFMLSTWSCRALQCPHLIKQEYTSAVGCGYGKETHNG